MRKLSLILAFMLAACGSSDPSTNRNNDNNQNNVNNVNNVNNANNVEDMAVEGTTLRIATFNVRRFFDTVCASSTCGGDAFEDINSEAEFNFKADQLTKALDGLDADAVMVQEFETQDCVDAIMERTETFDFGVLGETGGRGSLDVAVFGRGEQIKVVSHKDLTLALPGGGSTSFARDFLEVHAELQGIPVVLFSAHFISQRNAGNDGRRLAEAQGAEGIMSAVVDENPESLVILGGDLNDEPGSAPINELDTGELSVLQEEGVWTYRYFDDLSHLDHLVVGGPAIDAYVDGSLSAVRDGPEGYGPSDHSALTAEFFIPDE